MKSLNHMSTDERRALEFNPSDTNNAYVMTGAAISATVPSGAVVAGFSATGNFYANFNGGSAAVPAANVTDGTAPELNPSTRRVAGVSSISLIGAAGVVVVISYYN